MEILVDHDKGKSPVTMRSLGYIMSRDYEAHLKIALTYESDAQKVISL